MTLGVIGPGSIALIAAPILLFLFIRYYWKWFKKRKVNNER
jgi:hypothetical protein